MNVLTMSRRKLETEPPKGMASIVMFSDEPGLLNSTLIGSQLRSLVFCHDATESYGQVKAPDHLTAEVLLRTCRYAQKMDYTNLVFVCDAGVGRSHAAAAAWLKINGQDNGKYLEQGTYNKLLYRLMLEAAGLEVEPDPLVSIVVRLKYKDRINGFMLSVENQRYHNWEVIAVSDGEPSSAALMSRLLYEGKVNLITTPEPKGRWGHPYRQLGIDAARGKYIGLNNDDNYLTPGYIEQLVYAMETRKVPLALCGVAHSYSGWAQTAPGSDLGAWLAAAELVKGTPWTGVEFDSDAKYLTELKRKAGHWAEITKPLLVHN